MKSVIRCFLLVCVCIMSIISPAYCAGTSEDYCIILSNANDERVTVGRVIVVLSDDRFVEVHIEDGTVGNISRRDVYEAADTNEDGDSITLAITTALEGEIDEPLASDETDEDVIHIDNNLVDTIEITLKDGRKTVFSVPVDKFDDFTIEGLVALIEASDIGDSRITIYE